MRIFDSHAHYDDARYDDDREEMLGKLQENGVFVMKSLFQA